MKSGAKKKNDRDTYEHCKERNKLKIYFGA